MTSSKISNVPKIKDIFYVLFLGLAAVLIPFFGIVGGVWGILMGQNEYDRRFGVFLVFIGTFAGISYYISTNNLEPTIWGILVLL